MNGHGDCVQLLIAANATIDQAASNGCTPLSAACCHGYSNCVKLLIAANATIDHAASNGTISGLLFRVSR